MAASTDIVIALFAPHVARIFVQFEDLLVALLTSLASASFLSLVCRLELIFGQRLQYVLFFAFNLVRILSQLSNLFRLGRDYRKVVQLALEIADQCIS